MNNSVFGKTTENIENRVDMKLVTNEKEAIPLTAKPNYGSSTMFDENLIDIHMKRTKLVDNKPIYLGMCIAEISMWRIVQAVINPHGVRASRCTM